EIGGAAARAIPGKWPFSWNSSNPAGSGRREPRWALRRSMLYLRGADTEPFSHSLGWKLSEYFLKPPEPQSPAARSANPSSPAPDLFGMALRRFLRGNCAHFDPQQFQWARSQTFSARSQKVCRSGIWSGT